MDIVIHEREKNGSFASIFDLAGRVDPQAINRRLIENLIAAGALDCINSNRAELFAGIELIISYAQSKSADRQSGQFNFLNDQSVGMTDTPRLEVVDEWPQVERLERELSAVGFYLSAHPLDEYAKALQRLGVPSFNNLHDTVLANGGTMIVSLAGTVLNIQHRTSQRGNKYAFIQLSDGSGVYEVTAFSEVLGNHRDLLQAGTKPLLLKVLARIEEGQLRLTLQSLIDIESAAESAPMSIQVWLDKAETLSTLKLVIDKEINTKKTKDGRAKISLMIPSVDRDIEVRLEGAFTYTTNVCDAIRSIPGVIEVVEA
jgi:DNA polymerase-3 subunit alpha